MIDIDDTLTEAFGEVETIVASIERVMRTKLADAMVEVWTGYADDIARQATDGADDWADENAAVDDDEDETTWNASEVHGIAAEAYEAGWTAAHEAMAEAIKAGLYTGWRPTEIKQD